MSRRGMLYGRKSHVSVTGEIKDSWEEIIENIHAGKAQEFYKVGSWKNIEFKPGYVSSKVGTLPVQTVPVAIGGFNVNTKSDGSGTCPTSWVFMKATPGHVPSGKTNDMMPDIINQNVLQFTHPYIQNTTSNTSLAVTANKSTNKAYYSFLSANDMNVLYPGLFPDQNSRIRVSTHYGVAVAYVLEDKCRYNSSTDSTWGVKKDGGFIYYAYADQHYNNGKNPNDVPHSVVCFCL